MRHERTTNTGINNTMMGTWIRGAAAAAALMTVLAGCGSAGGDTGSEGPESALPTASKVTDQWSRAQCGRASEDQWVEHGCDQAMQPVGTKAPKHMVKALTVGASVTYPYVTDDSDYGDVYRTTMRVTLLKVHEVKVELDGYENPRPDPGKRWYCLKFKVENIGKRDDGSLGLGWEAVAADGRATDASNTISCPSYEKSAEDIATTDVDAGQYIVGWTSVEVSTKRTTVTNVDSTVMTPEPVDLFKIIFPAV